MPLRHILEYDETDIRDLMGDLDSVGQMKSLQGTLWAHFNTFRLGEDYWSYNPESVCFLKTGPFYGTGDEDKDKAIMLQKIQSGDFVTPKDPDARSWAFLQENNPMAMGFLEKSKVQSLSKTSSTMDELLEAIREALVRSQKFALQGQMHKTRYWDSEEAASNVLVYGFLGPEGSPYLVAANLEKPFQKGSGINYVE
jgi:hypothetical protein